MKELIVKKAEEYRALAVEILAEAVRIPADYVDRPTAQGGDPLCGLSNHEGPRLEFLKKKLEEVGGVGKPEDVRFDAFGNLRWTLKDENDGIQDDDKTVIYWDGHTDTVRALRDRWTSAIGGGIDAYNGLVDGKKVNHDFLKKELGYLPPDADWQHLVWGRGSADQLGGVVCQIVASKILMEMKSQGALKGVIIESVASVAEEDNDGGGPMYIARHEFPGAPPARLPDVVILTEGTGCAQKGAVGLYRGQRGRMQIEVEVIGKSCHGSMPWEGRNPLEFGARILVEASDRYDAGEGFAKDEFLGPGTRTASTATLDTPSDCAVPERFTFRFDRRLTAGEDPEQARADVEALPAVARARAAGLTVNVSVPFYADKTWKGATPGNPQIYPGWLTPEDHPAITAAAETYRQVVTPQVTGTDTAGQMRREPRVARWIFSTDGVGFPVRRDDASVQVPATKQWVHLGPFHHPAMFGIGPGIEQNTHKIGECMDSREMSACIAFLAGYAGVLRGGA